MQRREVIKLGLACGATLMMEPLGGLQEAEAASKKVTFYDGTADGGPFAGWRLILASTGSAVRGTLYDPNSIIKNDLYARFTGYRVRGTASTQGLSLNFYALPDTAFATPVGTGPGSKAGKKATSGFNGSITIGADAGTYHVLPVKLAPSKSKPFLGHYFIIMLFNGVALIQGKAVVTNGLISLSQVTDDRGPAFGTPSSGQARFGVTANGTMWVVSMLSDLQGIRSPASTPSEVQILHITRRGSQAGRIDTRDQAVPEMCTCPCIDSF
jgi:hypothetical protein